MLGSALLKRLEHHSGISVLATAQKWDSQIAYAPNIELGCLDITDAQQVRSVILGYQPDIIVHAAALTQADTCELDHLLCWKTNVTATRFLLTAAAEVKSRFIFLSTDFVFSGASGPYREEDVTEPVNYYGCSKMIAEQSVKAYPYQWNIIRTVLVYGSPSAGGRQNLFSWVLNSLKNRERIQVVNDQIRTPTFIEDLVNSLHTLIHTPINGVFHISGKDTCSPYEFSNKVAAVFEKDAGCIVPVHSGIFSQPAIRPPKTGFVIEKARALLNFEPKSIEEALQNLKKEYGQ